MADGSEDGKGVEVRQAWVEGFPPRLSATATSRGKGRGRSGRRLSPERGCLAPPAINPAVPLLFRHLPNPVPFFSCAVIANICCRSPSRAESAQAEQWQQLFHFAPGQRFLFSLHLPFCVQFMFLGCFSGFFFLPVTPLYVEEGFGGAHAPTHCWLSGPGGMLCPSLGCREGIGAKGGGEYPASWKENDSNCGVKSTPNTSTQHKRAIRPSCGARHTASEWIHLHGE